MPQMKPNESDSSTSDTIEMNDETQPLSPVYGSVQLKFCMFADGWSRDCVTGDLSPTKLLQKRRCFKDLRPAFHTTDPKERIAQAARNLHNFKQFSALLHEAQDAVLKRVPWGNPVAVGRHMSRTIDHRTRGMKSPIPVKEESDEEENNDKEIKGKRNGTPLKLESENSKKPRRAILATETQDLKLDLKDSQAESIPETQMLVEEARPVEKGVARKRKVQQLQMLQSLFSTESSDEHEEFVSLAVKRKRKTKSRESPLKEVNKNLNRDILQAKNKEEKSVIIVLDDGGTPENDHDPQEVKEVKEVKQPDSEVKSEEAVSTMIAHQSSEELPTFPTSPIPRRKTSRLSRKPRRVKVKSIDEQEVSCPLCDEMFQVDLIQRHAADCDGKSIPSPSTDSWWFSNAENKITRLQCPMCHQEIAGENYEKHVMSCVDESEMKYEESQDNKRGRSRRNPEEGHHLRGKTSRKRRL
ncbi:hypothetical protein CAPTEDRAFT_187567 [Capitella teleta]|uniref:UBZ4-type domain-containing protein n=1 Tax=Capitella teleta TaxID=283909 RepID=R7UDC8_CAPTE|nr:hypothetical protein CAPTEDRAFT_187567 [Capitella teleta]|eukprot:ELU04111.1 hypothetical protein CAPTEDRAFT_187567 [Capitella teleta]